MRVSTRTEPSAETRVLDQLEVLRYCEAEMKNSAAPGFDTSTVQVTNVSGHGIRLLAHGAEDFVPYDKFPWFLDAPVSAISNFEQPSVCHFYLPDLDVDVVVETVEHPERFPLVATWTLLFTYPQTRLFVVRP